MERIKRNTENREKYALEIFSSQAYFTVNKKLLIHYGPEVTIFLSNLIDKYKYFLDKELLDNDWFFMTHEKQIEQTGLTITKIRNCKLILRKDNILKTKFKGLPLKEWYKLNLNHLLDIIPFKGNPSVVLTDSRQETVGLAVSSSDGIYNKTKYNKIKYKDNISLENSSLPKIPITKVSFEKFWHMYPRKVDKGKTLTIWYRICQKKPEDRPTWEQITTAIQEQKRSERWQDPKFIPHPSTWLNQQRWLDDASEMKAYKDFSSAKNKPAKIVEYGEWWYLRDDGKYYNKNNQSLII